MNNYFCNGNKCTHKNYQQQSQQHLLLSKIPINTWNKYPQNDINIAEYVPNNNLTGNYTTRPAYKTALKKMNGQIYQIEVREALRNLSVSVNHGNGIHIRTILPIKKRIVPLLTWFINICWKSGYFPNVFKLKQFSPQCKPSKNPHDPELYRQISLMGIMRKIIEYIIKERLMEYLIKLHLISDASMAAFKGKSGIDAITVVLDTIRNKFKQNLPTYAVYMDIKDCYPSQHYDITINRYKTHYGIYGNMLNMLTNLLKDNYAQTIVNGIPSDWMLVEKGLGQGNVISQLQNFMFLEPMNKVIKSPKIINLISFIDDFILYTTLNKPLVKILNDMIQLNIDKCNEWLKNNKLQIKIEKTETIIYESNIIQNRYPQNVAKIQLDMTGNGTITHGMHNKSNIKYLGSTINKSLNMTVTVGAIAQRVHYTMYVIEKTFRRLHKMNAYVLYIIINALILGALGYDIIFTVTATQKQLQPIKKIWNRAMRLLLGGLHTTPIKALQYLSGYGYIQNWIHYKNAKYFYQLLHKPLHNPVSKIIDDKWYKYWFNDHMTQKGLPQNAKLSKKSPLWMVYESAKLFNLTTHINFTQYKNYHYHIKHIGYKLLLPNPPKNMQFDNEPYSATQNINEDYDCIFVYTDASIKEKIAGIGIYIEEHTPSQKHNNPIKYKYTMITQWKTCIGKQNDINFAEAEGVYNSLDWIYQQKEIKWVKYKGIRVIIDNDNVFNWLQRTYNTKEMYNYKKMKDIYTMSKQIYEVQKLKLTFQWCQRGIWRGNNKADKLAKEAVEQNLNNPFVANIKPEQISEKRMKNILKKELNQLNSTKIQQNTKLVIISRNMYIWNKYKEIYKPKYDLRIMSKGQLSIITKLRTQHINLNYFKHKYEHYDYYKTQYKQHKYIKTYLICTNKCCKKYNGGKCKQCNKWETVYHYLCKCNKYFMLRTKMLLDIQYILNKKNIKLTLKHILFPPISLQWQHRKQIFDGITNYVTNTGRFKY